MACACTETKPDLPGHLCQHCAPSKKSASGRSKCHSLYPFLHTHRQREKLIFGDGQTKHCLTRQTIIRPCSHEWNELLWNFLYNALIHYKYFLRHFLYKKKWNIDYITIAHICVIHLSCRMLWNNGIFLVPCWTVSAGGLRLDLVSGYWKFGPAWRRGWNVNRQASLLPVHLLIDSVGGSEAKIEAVTSRWQLPTTEKCCSSACTFHSEPTHYAPCPLFIEPLWRTEKCII